MLVAVEHGVACDPLDGIELPFRHSGVAVEPDGGACLIETRRVSDTPHLIVVVDDADAQGDRRERHRRVVEAVDMPGTSSTLEARRETVVEILEYLADREGQSVYAGDLKQLIDAEATGYKSADLFWANVVRSRKVFDELPVETPASGGSKYRHDHDSRGAE